MSVFYFLCLGDEVPNQLPYLPRHIKVAPGNTIHARVAGESVNFLQDIDLSGHLSTKLPKSPRHRIHSRSNKAGISMFKTQIIFVSHFSHIVELKEEGKFTDAVQEGEMHSRYRVAPSIPESCSLLWE